MAATPTFDRSDPSASLFYLDTSALQRCGDTYAAAFLPGQPPPPATMQIDLPTSWTTSPGYYLFLGGAPTTEATFLGAFRQVFGFAPLRGARFVWLANPNDPPQLWQFSAIPVAAGASATPSPAQVALRNLALAFPTGTAVALGADDASLVFTAGAPGFAFRTRYGDATLDDVGSTVTLPFAGQALGALQFDLTLPGQPTRGPTNPDALDLLDAGCRLFTDNADFAGSGLLRSYRYPVFDLARQGMTLAATLDPILPTCADRTFFAIQPPAGGAALDSFYRSNLGVPLPLTPTATSRFVLEIAPTSQTPLPTDSYYLTPAGEFTVAAPAAAAAADGNDVPIGPNLMCGLSGVEYAALSPAAPNVLDLAPGQNAYSPIAPPIVAGATHTYRPLTDLALTSWAYLSSTPPLTYYAQPDGSVLHGIRQGDANPATNQFLDYLELQAGTLAAPAQDTQPTPFPLLPYAGLVEAADPNELLQLEVQVVSPQRRQTIGGVGSNGAANAAAPRPGPGWPRAGVAGDGSVDGATPTGLKVTFDATLTDWQSLTIASTDGGLLQLANVRGALKSALQTNQLFLVITSPKKLSDCADIAGGTLAMAGYTFDVVAQNSTELASNVVLIFKFMNKSIQDLVKDTSAWTGAADFNDDPNVTLTMLQKVVASASSGKAQVPDLANFVDVVTLPTWNGVLILNAPVVDLPKDVEGLMAGVDPSLFVAHHLGVNLSPISHDGASLTMGNTSLFGFINYDDDRQMVFNGDPYQFRVKSLRVLFQNSAVKDFSSVVQLWVNSFFGEAAVLQNATNGNEIDFYGVYQDHDGDGSYLFLSQADYVFAMQSSVLQQVEVQKAQFVTVSVTPGQDNQQTVLSRFLFWGNLRFHDLRVGSQDFDLFSFGLDEDGNHQNDGQLSFVNLALDMQSLLSGSTTLSTQFTLDLAQVAFDLANSQARAGSLFNHFPLKLTGLIQGKIGTVPTGTGYIQVSTPLIQNQVGDPWFALQFELNLGTVGALAGQAGFVATLLAAWSPNPSGYTVFTGLQLPGTNGTKKEISIEGVLKITFGAIVFVVGGPGIYLLRLQNIGISFLSKTLPPDGQTSIWIFGDPDPGTHNRTLGWYAAYAKNPPKPSGPPARPSVAAQRRLALMRAGAAAGAGGA